MKMLFRKIHLGDLGLKKKNRSNQPCGKMFLIKVL